MPVKTTINNDKDDSENIKTNVLNDIELQNKENDDPSENIPKNNVLNDLEIQNEQNDNDPNENIQNNVLNDIEVQNDQNDNDPNEKHATLGRPRKGRKRKYPSQNRAERTINCIQNKGYITQRGSVKMPKEFRQYLCRCDCLNKVGIERAQEEYKKFYSVTSHDAQRALICAMVNDFPIKRKRNKNSQKRNRSRRFTINDVTVCKPFFLQTLRISSGKVDLAIKSMKRTEGVKDLRGIGGGKNKISEQKHQEVTTHIQSFPKYKSHYARETTNAMFLRSDTTLPIMYDLYKQEVMSPVSFSKYKHIFLTCFNLKRKPLKKDTCNTCDRLNILEKSGTQQQQDMYQKQKESHLKSAEESRMLLKSDRMRAKDDNNLEVLCFDLEKTLPLPRIPTNVVFYKRQLWLYNMGIHTSKNNKGHCYVWLEGDAGRGAQEVGSGLFRHIMNDPDMQDCKSLILWSDSCGGQNRNIKIVLMLKAILDVHPSLTKITLRFLTSGHSFLPNDTDFGDIECALKLQQRLYSPNDYINIMRGCRRKNPLIVHRMEREHFYGTGRLEKAIVNRKSDIRNNKINWFKFKEIEMQKEKPFSIFVKSNDFQSEAQEINIQRKRGRPSETRENFNEYLDQLWPNGKAISTKKLDDLKFLLPFIPKDDQKFYKKLIGDPNLEEDIDGFNIETLDFEVEE